MELNRIKGKIAFISGASSGIGKAVAEKLAQMGVNLILCARRAEVLAELKAQLEKEHAVEVITLAFDVRNYQEVAKNIQSLPEKWQQIEILINNAGLAMGVQSLLGVILKLGSESKGKQGKASTITILSSRSEALAAIFIARMPPKLCPTIVGFWMFSFLI